MTANISNLFQQTLQTSSTWIREIAEAVPGADEQQAYHLLCATLRTLRDRLLPEEAVQFGAQLPVLIRGLYYDGWRLADVPVRLRTRQEFLAQVLARYQARPLDIEAGARAVLAVASRNIDFGETYQILRTLPVDLRQLWPEHMVQAA
jgi:uncharacterized protein (DUF2267 family)